MQLHFGVYKNPFLSLHYLMLCEYALHSDKDIEGYKAHAEDSWNIWWESLAWPSSLCPFNCHALSAPHMTVHKIIAC